MHHELTKALYDVYPLEDKNDFFPAFLYMKYIENFIWHAFQASGLPVKEPRQKVPEEIDAMLKFYVQQIADSSATTDRFQRNRACHLHMKRACSWAIPSRPS